MQQPVRKGNTQSRQGTCRSQSPNPVAQKTREQEPLQMEASTSSRDVVDSEFWTPQDWRGESHEGSRTRDCGCAYRWVGQKKTMPMHQSLRRESEWLLLRKRQQEESRPHGRLRAALEETRCLGGSLCKRSRAMAARVHRSA